MPDMVAVILAGGVGRRIGGGKPELQLGGKRLIEHAIAKARAWGLTPRLSVRRKDQVPDTFCEKILDADYEGPIAGLIASMQWSESNGAERLLILPCDMPFLPDDLLMRLSEVQQESGLPVVAASAGRWHPVCALWPAACLANLRAYADAGGKSLSGALKHSAAIAAPWADDPFDPFFNINTHEDLKVAATIAGLSSAECEASR